ncbi:FIG01149307: hypothetical protein [Candidatus Synechococcus spongiarum]|uniref:Proline-rich region n=1 Tax=Candidatus Synechococcus spongiarum TaxID=431041 RepID=A0A164Y153_9SYNE|nr:FIG01149307: hypothetical protein [Candidatus Synechococcus spongiarum]
MRLQPLLAGRPTLGQYPRQPRDLPARDRVGARLKHRRHTRTALKPGHARRVPVRTWPLVGIVGISAVAVGALVVLAPTLTDNGDTWQNQDWPPQDTGVAEPLRVALDGEHFYQLDLDPRQVEFGLLRGWDREQEAFADPDALAFISGPMYERYYWPDPRLEQIIDQTVQPSSPHRAKDQGYTVPLGDLKFGPEIWRGLNRAAAGQRAFIGIDDAGEVTFGYGELTAKRARTYETFIGGLHVLYNDLQPVQPGYQGAYSKGMGQKIRYYLPRIRLVIGLRPDRRLEVLMSKDGLTLEETQELSRKRGLVAAYLPDHASKSRFIVPGVKGFSEEDANWISGGSTSYVHVPYMIRVSRRRQTRAVEQRPPIALAPAPRDASCDGPFSCARQGVLWAGDRSLSGLNRLMGAVLGGGSLPEPPITADPRAAQLKSLPSGTVASSAPDDLNLPGDQPVDLAWAPNPDRGPARHLRSETITTPAMVQDDMAEPIVVPQDADEDFWNRSLPPSLPALDPGRGLGAAAPLPKLELSRATAGDEPLPKLPSIHVASGEEVTSTRYFPPPPALDMVVDAPPTIPRLDLGRE